ncbi:type II toxin-antitoxin system RelE/ParE family toxin [Echinicola strongylocentroti]|uniref:Type II toxin-antitoxin system RelE/ParE family toxin n=1 Tax=Echinicola strongylocentroti TaxID=1795355 RepID=A0A2Z4IEU6_9BACT|nr:type II toxin-antitoxin system RelE/ParE family toxin [Echinicola strongylocentroti]AWW29186.1 type II toxin-antitoxin system RelE/ParE family toxin [Echinicola strongylocentroti]
MDKVREVIAYQDHFEVFLKKQTEKVQNKIYKVIEAIETLERVPETYLKAIKTKKGLYEARVQLGSNIWRVFCFFDEGKLVILLNGFQKKTQKTPIQEIEKASKLMNDYYAEKEVEKKKNKKS